MHQNQSPSFWDFAFPTALDFPHKTTLGFQSSCHVLKESSSALEYIHLDPPNVTGYWQTVTLRKSTPKRMHNIKRREKAINAHTKQQKYTTKYRYHFKEELRTPERLTIHGIKVVTSWQCTLGMS